MNMLKNPWTSLFDQFLNIAPSGSALANLKETEIGLELQIAVPGYSKEEIHVQVDNGILKISGKKEIKSEEKYYWKEFGNASFTRSFSLPKEIDIDQSEATHTDGVLKMILPFSKKEKRSNIIKIN